MTDIATPVSASSRVRDYLVENSRTVGEFTSANISEKLGISFGAASGFISKAVKAGALYKAGRVGINTSYRIESLSLLKEMPVKIKPGFGSNPGKASAGRGPLPPLRVPEASLSEQLLEIASRVDKLRPLSDYTTDELLAEIRRRTSG